MKRIILIFCVFFNLIINVSVVQAYYECKISSLEQRQELFDEIFIGTVVDQHKTELDYTDIIEVKLEVKESIKSNHKTHHLIIVDKSKQPAQYGGYNDGFYEVFTGASYLIYANYVDKVEGFSLLQGYLQVNVCDKPILIQEEHKGSDLRTIAQGFIDQKIALNEKARLLNESSQNDKQDPFWLIILAIYSLWDCWFSLF